MTKQKKFIIAVAIQLAILFIIIITKVATLTGGTDVVLRIRPVDPRDPLRGDYVTFNYDISSINSYIVRDVNEIKNGNTVYVALREAGKYWTALTVSVKKPADGIFIKGKVVSGGVKNEGDIISPRQSSDIRIIYGIEEYFIPEGKGQDFVFGDKETVARVMVDKNGNPVLKQIYVDNNLWP